MLGLGLLSGSAGAQDSDASLTCDRTDVRCKESSTCCSGRCRKVRGKSYKTCRCIGEGRNCKIDGKKRDALCCSGVCNSKGKCAASDD